MEVKSSTSQIYRALEYGRGRIAEFLNWRLVRSIGELQVLTRVSYLMLVLVPFLAATWPYVQSLIEGYGRSIDALEVRITNKLDRLESAQKQLALEAERLDSLLGADAAERGSAAVARIAEDHRVFQQETQEFFRRLPRPTFPPFLPWVWAAAFFGALSVAIAHLSYQLFTPEEVRRETLDAFVRRRKRDFAEHPTEIGLRRAKRFLRSAAGQKGLLRRTYEQKDLLGGLLVSSKAERSERLEAMSCGKLSDVEVLIDHIVSNEAHLLPTEKWPVDGLKLLTSEIRATLDEKLKREGDSAKQQVNLTFIERGAAAEYLTLASARWSAALLTGFLYGVGILILISIVRVQATAVLEEAQWETPFDAIRPFPEGAPPDEP